MLLILPNLKKRCDNIVNDKSSKSKDKKKCPNVFFTGNNIRYTNDIIHKIGLIFCHVNNMDDILGIVKEAKKFQILRYLIFIK